MTKQELDALTENIAMGFIEWEETLYHDQLNGPDDDAINMDAMQIITKEKDVAMLLGNLIIEYHKSKHPIVNGGEAK